MEPRHVLDTTYYTCVTKSVPFDSSVLKMLVMQYLSILCITVQAKITFVEQ